MGEGLRLRVRYGDLIAADAVRDRWEDGAGRWSRGLRVINKRTPARTGEGSRTI